MKKLLSFLFVGLTISTFANCKLEQDLASFLPKGYEIIEQIKGDLNNDGVVDYLLLIKGTDKSKIVKDEDGEVVDTNKRGLIVVFDNNGKYVQGPKNYSCFSPEDVDGGVYYAPDMSIEIEKGKLYVKYGHGRYGHNSYTFRYNAGDFDLIGYDESNNNGPTVSSEVSINFLTKQKITKENISEDPEKEVFKEVKTRVKVDKLLKLSEIESFEELDFS